MSDPITLVYDALWSILENSDDFTNAVLVGNRIKFSGTNTAPIKEETITNDYPEVRIVSVSSTPHIFRTSNGSSLVKQFAIQILTGDQRVTEKLFPLEWIIYRALVNGLSTLLGLEWNGKKFVKNVTPISVGDSFRTDRELTPAIRGWLSVWACNVEMWFNTADLIVS